jgi:hypothetical protein
LRVNHIKILWVLLSFAVAAHVQKANLKSGKSTLSVAGELNDKEGTTVKVTVTTKDK